MQKLRRINFFDRKIVKQGEAEVHPGVHALSVACLCGGPERLWLGDQGGEIRSLDRHHILSPPVQLFDWHLVDIALARDGQFLVALGGDASPPSSRYKIYSVQQDTLQPTCYGIPVQGSELRVTCFAVTAALTAVVIGTDYGMLQLFRGRDLSQEKPAGTWLGDESDPPITSVDFLEQDKRTVLFACDMNSVRSWAVGPDRKSRIQLLNLDSAHGAISGCSCVFPSFQAMFLAKSDGIYSFDPDEGLMTAMPLDGSKVALSSSGSYLVSVAADGGGPVLEGSPSGTAPSQTVSVCLIRPHVRFIAYSGQFPDVSHVVEAMGSIFVASRSAEGSTLLFELCEKKLSERLEVLMQKRMFEWAASLALHWGAPTEIVVNIYKAHGNALFAKRAYDQALAVYMQSVNLGLPLEPSFVVERFLDVQKIAHVAKYLRLLHEKHLADREHTTLLLKCYTKLKDSSMLEDFVRNTPVTQFDPVTAIEVLELTGYYRLATLIAQRPEVERRGEYVRMSLEHFDTHADVIAYIRDLPVDAATEILREHGATLLRCAPQETTCFLQDLCGICRDGGAATPPSVCIDELLPMFSSGAPHLEALLRALLLDPRGCALPPKEAGMLFPVLLELMLRTYSELRCAGDDASREEESRRPPLCAEIMRLVEQRAQSEEALATTLMLSQTFDFVDGIFYAAEKLGRVQLLMNWCFERRDVRRLIRVCKQCEHLERSIWVQALSFLASDGERHAEEIGEVLRHIESSDLMPLMMVIDTLRKPKNSSVTLGDARAYLQGQFRRLTASVEVSRGKVQQDTEEIARMEHELTSMRTEAQIFQNTSCSQCSLALEVPMIHLLCGHSYHSYCMTTDGTCPKCSAEALPKTMMLERREAQSKNIEGFFRQLQGSSGDEQLRATGEWCKLGACDVGASGGKGA